MLKQAANEPLTQVGRATAVDAVIRRYWIPVLLREEIPDPTAIPCADRARAAELLSLADRIGAVKPGYFADLLVVRGDPVSNITATRSVALVIKSGRVVFAEDPSLPPAGL
jgi:predicted amidohydrolase YtcJ